MELHPLVLGQVRYGLECGELKRRDAGPTGMALWSAHCLATVLSGVNVTEAEKRLINPLHISEHNGKMPQ